MQGKQHMQCFFTYSTTAAAYTLRFYSEVLVVTLPCMLQLGPPAARWLNTVNTVNTIRLQGRS
jgi:hypothetical protein